MVREEEGLDVIHVVEGAPGRGVGRGGTIEGWGGVGIGIVDRYRTAETHETALKGQVYTGEGGWGSGEGDADFVRFCWCRIVVGGEVRAVPGE